MKKIYKLALAACGLFALTSMLHSAGLNVSAREKTAVPAPIKITVGYPKLRVNLAQFVAKEEGIFARHGLDVTMLPFETAQPMIQAQIAGRLGIAGYSAMSISFPAALSSGRSLLFGGLMLEDKKHPFSMLIVGAKSEIRRIADLKGKAVGILPTVAFREMLKAILLKNGVSPDDVVIKNVNVPMQQAALESGSVQALFTVDPAATAITAGGKGRLLDKKVPSPCAAYLRDPYPFASATVTREFYAKNPEAVKRYFAALDEAVDFIRAHPEKAKDHMKPYISAELRAFTGKFPESRYLKTADALASPELFQAAADEYLRWGLLAEKYAVGADLYTGK